MDQKPEVIQYLATIAKILLSEGDLSMATFEAKVLPWLPIRRHAKTKEILFPLPADIEFVRGQYQFWRASPPFKVRGIYV